MSCGSQRPFKYYFVISTDGWWVLVEGDIFYTEPPSHSTLSFYPIAHYGVLLGNDL